MKKFKMNNKYLIYLDVCCLNRPFDNQKQTRIRLESEAILIALDKFKSNEWQLITSNAIEAEISQISNREKLKEIIQILSLATVRILVNKTIEKRTLELSKLGFSVYDAAHIACAEEALSDVLLTTDDRLIKRYLKYTDIIKITVANPLDWITDFS